jgi:outer membrane immunogenic protein
VNGGWGISRATSTTNFAGGLLDGVVVSNSANRSGGLVGAQMGFNWQISWFVFGGEVDGMWAIGQQTTNSIVCGAACLAVENTNLKSMWTSRLRFGAAFDRVLFYATGGMAFVTASETLTMTSGAATATLVPFSQGKTGWTAGLGVEGAFWGHWSARLEYLYVEAWGSNNTNGVPAVFSVPTVVESARYRDNIVRAGINYRFGP